MADRDRTNDDEQARGQADPRDGEQSTRGKDMMRGRSFAGANIANTERDQTRDRQRIADHGGESLDEIGDVTDAEIEVRENNED
jgi:hypothetical protein